MKLRTLLNRILCRQGHHDWILRHPPIWQGGYKECLNCEARTVVGADQHSPAATAWTQHGHPPPAPLTGRMFTDGDWRQWEAFVARTREHQL